MSYQVLARKYRPKSFDTLVGQEHVVRALTHALEQQRLHHAYLFTGTRGVGKTTLSRILAKSLNCEKGISATPCGVCEACSAIDAGRFVDYIEMDAASNRGVDEMAQLLEQAIYAPSNARFKVYMIDEVHMLTNHAFNAMLKTLEEPPAHVKFILATTDPQKIPVTVLSRCLQFNLKQMPPGHIVGHLENILGQEQIAFDAPALRLLAQGAHGSMRDALSLTDQAIAYAAGKVTLEAVQGMLGALDQSYLVRVMDALADQDGASLLAVADDMAARSLSYNAALQDLGTLLHRIALAQTVPAAVPEDLPEREDILRLATRFDAEEIQLFYQIAVHGRNELSLAPDEFAGFSMTLLRMLAFRPEMGGDRTDTPSKAPDRAAAPVRVSSQTSQPAQAAQARQAAQLVTDATSAQPAESAPVQAPVQVRSSTTPYSPARAALEAARSAGKLPAAAPAKSSTPAAATAPRSAAVPATLQTPAVPPAPPPWDEEFPSAHQQSMPGDFSMEAQKKTEAAAHAAANAFITDDSLAVMEAPPARRAPELALPGATAVPSAQASAPVAASSIAPTTASATTPAPVRAIVPVAELDWDGDWPSLAAALPLRGVVHQLALQSELVGCAAQGNAMLFTLRIPVDTLRSAGSVDKLAQALSEHFGKPIRVETVIGAVAQTANAQAIAEREARQREAEEKMQNDPFVQALMREFNAVIVPGSVKPS